MGRRRRTHRHLPARIYWKNGRFRYLDYNNKWHTLGKTELEAIVEHAKLLQRNEKTDLMKDLFNVYLVEVSAKMSEKTHREDRYCIARLNMVFGHMRAPDIEPADIYVYLDTRKDTPRSANIDINVLQNVFKLAIRKGVLKTNPCKEVDRLEEKRKERKKVSNETLKIFMEHSPPVLRLATEFFDITGLRKKDVREFMLVSKTEDGLRVKTSKKGKVILFRWTPDLRKCVDDILKLPRPINGEYLFYSNLGTPFKESGFNSMWQRTIVKLIKSGLIKKEDRFSYHDIRRRVASDVRKARGLDAARDFLTHSSTSETMKYIVDEIEVTPLR